MEVFSRLLTALAAAVTITAGVQATLADHTASATAAFSIAFLFLVLLLISKFRRVRGFGFEMETWEEAQVQAAVLIDRLSRLAEAMARQLALIVANLGLMTSGLSQPELGRLLRELVALLEASGTTRATRDELLAPILTRIKRNYWFAAQGVCRRAFEAALKELESANQNAPTDQRSAIVARITRLGEDRARFYALSFDEVQNAGAFDPVFEIVRSTPDFPRSGAYLSDLAEIESDLRHFIASGQLRRPDLDLNTAYPY